MTISYGELWFLAIQKGDIEKMGKLIKRGDIPDADVYDMEGCPSIVRAAQYQKEDVLTFLLELGADVNAANDYGVTALHWAHNTDVARLLIEHGADVNAQTQANHTPIWWTLKDKRFDVAQVLMANGADLSIRDYSGETIFDVSWGDEEITAFVETTGRDWRKMRKIKEHGGFSSAELYQRLVTAEGLKRIKVALAGDFSAVVKRMTYKDAMRAYVRIYKELSPSEKETYSKAVVALKNSDIAQNLSLKTKINERER